MRWLPFFILAYLVLGLQVGLRDFLAIQRATPNFVLIVVVFVTANATREAGLMAAFLLGLLQDVLGTEPLGLYALCYGLSGVLVTSARKVAYSDHPLTHLSLTLLAGLMTATVLTVHAWLRPAGTPQRIDDKLVLPAIGFSPGVAYLSALYTALLSPVVIWALNKFRGPMGLRVARSRY
jgi:rod shape-determining protein MreD